MGGGGGAVGKVSSNGGSYCAFLVVSKLTREKFGSNFLQIRWSLLPNFTFNSYVVGRTRKAMALTVILWLKAVFFEQVLSDTEIITTFHDSFIAEF